MARKPSIRTVPSGDRWAVRKDGAARVTKYFDTQAEADALGRSIAKNQQTEYALHDQKGRIREKDSYGNDPFPPKG